MNLSGRRLQLVAVGVAVGALLIWFVVLWGPQGGRISDGRDREDVAEQQNEQLALSIDRLRGSQERIAELTADLDRLKSAIPAQPDLGGLILSLDDVAASSGVTFMSISPSPPAESEVAGVPTEIGLAIDVTGGYFQVLDYLNRLAEQSRLIVVDGVAISSDGAANPMLTVNVSARAFTTAEVNEDGTGATTTTTEATS